MSHMYSSNPFHILASLLSLSSLGYAINFGGLEVIIALNTEAQRKYEEKKEETKVEKQD